jgi:outer membrane beta-barrel protein
MALRGAATACLLRLAVAFLALSYAAPEIADAQCIDEAIRDELNARRRYRGVRERLFQKALRHEISVMGGVYAADLLSASYVVQAAYTFHVTEDIGLEASFAYSEARSELVRIIENDRGISLIRIDQPVFVYQAHLIWTLAYGKLRWFGDTLGRFDFNLAIGGGLTDTSTSRGLMFSGGIGVKFYFDTWFSIRIDIRDQVLQQELLGESTVVNNLTATLGLSVFLPFTP